MNVNKKGLIEMGNEEINFNENEGNEENTDYLVTVFRTASQGTAAVARSILDEAGIQYLVKGEGIQNLIGYGIIGTGFNPLTGLIEFQVMPDDKDTAINLLGDLNESESIDEVNLIDEDIPENITGLDEDINEEYTEGEQDDDKY